METFGKKKKKKKKDNKGGLNMEELESALPADSGNDESAIGNDDSMAMEDDNFLGTKKKKKKKADINDLLKEVEQENNENGKCLMNKDKC